MSADSNADAAEQQPLELTVQEALILRGAINVLREIAVRPGIEPEVGVPLDSGREAVFRRLRSHLNNRIEAAATPTATIREVLDPAEAQAVRDAAGVLSTLLPDPGGRAILAEVGFLPSPDAPVMTAEIETLEDIADRVEPTGVRERAPVRGPGEMIDPTLSLEGIIANAEVPWPGFEQATFSLQGTIETFSGGDTTLGCEQILKNLVAVVKLTYAGALFFQPATSIRPSRPRSRRFAAQHESFEADATDAFLAVLSSIEVKHCLDPNAEERLGAEVDEFLDVLRAPASNTEIAQKALSTLQTLLLDDGAPSEVVEELEDALAEDLGREPGPATKTVYEVLLEGPLKTTSLDEAIENARRIIPNEPLPWQGFDDAISALEFLDVAITQSTSPPASSSCSQLGRHLVAVSMIAVAGYRHRDADDAGAGWERFVPMVDRTYDTILGDFEQGECAGQNRQDVIRRAVDDVVSSMRKEFGPGAQATTLLRNLRFIDAATRDELGMGEVARLREELQITGGKADELARTASEFAQKIAETAVSAPEAASEVALRTVREVSLPPNVRRADAIASIESVVEPLLRQLMR